MAEQAGRYWDLDRCCWVPSPRTEQVSVPPQAAGAEVEREAAGSNGADEVAVAPV